ncbi:hypothetical protein [Massilia endophytica]|uniref:hypothetical protein n=1 Tax=Massilia endophytica TaxID=2899220 RepID=UPI001E28ADA0|nr:hypothetical protein [Massilia endophytica]UGQ47820.1 hypothetical protein LSQ66_04945 [Massilia endophytica]
MRIQQRFYGGMRAAQILRWGTIIAVLDIGSALVYWSVFKDVAPARIFQSVAAGLLGREAFSGGIATALLGAGLHWAIACGMAAVFAALVRARPGLLGTPLLTACLTGLTIYALMNGVVVPLSNAMPFRLDWPWVAFNVIVSHMLCVGLCLVLLARRELARK